MAGRRFQQSRELGVFIDRLSVLQIAVSVLALTLLPAAAYWALSVYQFGNGLVFPTPERPTFVGALFFSVTTETTLGYGDIRAVGTSRLLAMTQVFCGLIIAGLCVAKITSIRGRDLRVLARRMSGDWIEQIKFEDGRVMITFARSYIRDGAIRWDGENYSDDGEPLGFFVSEMTEHDGDIVRFRYTNSDSSTEFFDHGVMTHRFTAEPSQRRWMRYHATSQDFGKNFAVQYEGVRASEKQAAIIHSDDNAARKDLLRQFAHAVMPKTPTEHTVRLNS